LSTHDDADIIESIWGHDKSKHGKKALGQELIQINPMVVKMFEKALGRLELKAYEDICICGDAILKDCETCMKTLVLVYHITTFSAIVVGVPISLITVTVISLHAKELPSLLPYLPAVLLLSIMTINHVFHLPTSSRGLNIEAVLLCLI
jgi:hypothetical protein